MAQGRLKWNHKGFEEILCCDGTKAACEEVADRIISSAESKGGFGYEKYSKIVKLFKSKRVRTTIRTQGKSAANESEKKALISSLH